MDAAPTGMKKGERGMATAVPLGLAAAARTWERRSVLGRVSVVSILSLIQRVSPL